MSFGFVVSSSRPSHEIDSSCRTWILVVFRHCRRRHRLRRRRSLRRFFFGPRRRPELLPSSSSISFVSTKRPASASRGATSRVATSTGNRPKRLPLPALLKVAAGTVALASYGTRSRSVSRRRRQTDKAGKRIVPTCVSRRSVAAPSSLSPTASGGIAREIEVCCLGNKEKALGTTEKVGSAPATWQAARAKTGT